MDGFLLIDKEKGFSSFDVVKKVRGLTREKHVGHAGTLDPLATGLMILAVGEGTKLLEYFVGCDKEYEVSAYFGKKSDTYDAEGEITVVDEKMYVDEEKIEEAIRENFLGEIEQVPPKYSALKIKGRRACDIVRAGGEVEMKSRKVKISRFSIREFDWPRVSFGVKCGSGTYIRSLVHDLGQKLGSGAYVTELRRTKVGNFTVDMAKSFSDFEDKVLKLEKSLISLEVVGSEFKRINITDEEYETLKNGGILLNKKIDQQNAWVAYCNDYLAGVIELSSNQAGVKFRKMIVR